MQKNLLSGTVLVLALGGVLAGCSGGASSDAPKEVNDAYHNKASGPAPTADQIAAGKKGPGFVGQPMSTPSPGGGSAPAPPEAMKGAGAPPSGTSK